MKSSFELAVKIELPRVKTGTADGSEVTRPRGIVEVPTMISEA